MTNMRNIIIVLLTAIVMISCKKTQNVIGETSSLTIINCMTVGNTIFPALTDPHKLSFSNKVIGLPALQEPVVTGYPAKIWGLVSGMAPLKVYVYPDSLVPAITKNLELRPGGIYSLFVTGTRDKIDTLFSKDDVPHIPIQDSMIVLRFVNLIKDGVPISVNMVNKTSMPTMENLRYKSITPYQTFKVKRTGAVEELVYFELRNANTDELISTFQYKWFAFSELGSTNYLSKNITCIIQDYLGTPACTVLDPKLIRTNLN